MAKALVFVDHKLATTMLHKIHDLNMKWFVVEEFGMMELLEQFRSRNGAPLILSGPFGGSLIRKMAETPIPECEIGSLWKNAKTRPAVQGFGSTNI